MSLVRVIARPMLASTFVVQGVRTLLDPDRVANSAKPVTDRMTPLMERYAPAMPTDTRTLIRLNAAVHVGAGTMLATGFMPRVAAAMLTGSMVPTTLAAHAFWQVDDPDERARQRVQLLKNAGLAGGLLLAVVDTEGRPSMLWRARHAAGSTRRSARAARRDARVAARSAAANVSRQGKRLGRR